jgi:hypothetical protein
MTRKIAIPLLLPFILFQSCLGDPIDQTIDTYHYYYNYLLESYSLQWEIDEAIIGSGHSYGNPADVIVSLKDSEQDVLIRSRNTENGQLVDSLSHTMFENGAYMIALLGTEEEPHLICEPMDTRIPSVGRVKFRILHTSEAMGPVDIYIGGDQPESMALSNVGFTHVSEYLEATEEQLWNAVIVTPANSLPADSTILEYTTNNDYLSGRVYLLILRHISNSSESSFQIQVDNQPVFH